MPTHPHDLSLAMPRNIIDHLEIGRSQVSDTDRERAICGSPENISHPQSASVFDEHLTFEEQFKLKYGMYASDSAIHITETCKVDTHTEEQRKQIVQTLPFPQDSDWLLLSTQKVYYSSYMNKYHEFSTK